MCAEEKRALRAEGLLLCAAVLVRLLALWLLGSAAAAEGKSAWEWGGESACLAESLEQGRGYGDPWAKGSGASGWLTPLYPGLLAILLRLCGGVGPQAAASLFVLQALASGATCVLVARLGSSLRAPRAGRIAGWIFAFYPPAIWHSVQTVWDTTFAAFGLTFFLWRLASAVAEPVPGPGAAPARSARLGLLFGLLCLLNPAPLAIGPVVLLALALGRPSRRAALASCAAFALGAALACVPWMARNARKVGSAALRPNFGVELMIGNNDASIGHPQPTRFHPSHVESEFALYQELGEGEYARACARRAWSWIRDHPGRFLGLTARRVLYFWLGEGPWSDERVSAGRSAFADPKSWLKFLSFASIGAVALLSLGLSPLDGRFRLCLGAMLFLYGVPYYVSHVSERYRFPLDPLLVLLCAALLARFLRARESSGG